MITIESYSNIIEKACDRSTTTQQAIKKIKKEARAKDIGTVINHINFLIDCVQVSEIKSLIVLQNRMQILSSALEAEASVKPLTINKSIFSKAITTIIQIAKFLSPFRKEDNPAILKHNLDVLTNKITTSLDKRLPEISDNFIANLRILNYPKIDKIAKIQQDILNNDTGLNSQFKAIYKHINSLSDDLLKFSAEGLKRGKAKLHKQEVDQSWPSQLNNKKFVIQAKKLVHEALLIKDPNEKLQYIHKKFPELAKSFIKETMSGDTLLPATIEILVAADNPKFVAELLKLDTTNVPSEGSSYQYNNLSMAINHIFNS